MIGVVREGGRDMREAADALQHERQRLSGSAAQARASCVHTGRQQPLSPKQIQLQLGAVAVAARRALAHPPNGRLQAGGGWLVEQAAAQAELRAARHAGAACLPGGCGRPLGPFAERLPLRSRGRSLHSTDRNRQLAADRWPEQEQQHRGRRRRRQAPTWHRLPCQRAQQAQHAPTPQKVLSRRAIGVCLLGWEE